MVTASKNIRRINNFISVILNPEIRAWSINRMFRTARDDKINKKTTKNLEVLKKSYNFASLLRGKHTVRLAQLVRASDCGSEGRGFETHISPH